MTQNRISYYNKLIETFTSFYKNKITNTFINIKDWFLFKLGFKVPSSHSIEDIKVLLVEETDSGAAYIIPYIKDSELKGVKTLRPLDIITSPRYIKTLNHILAKASEDKLTRHILYTTVMLETDDTLTLKSIKSQKLNKPREEVFSKLKEDLLSLDSRYKTTLIKTIIFNVYKYTTEKD